MRLTATMYYTYYHICFLLLLLSISLGTNTRRSILNNMASPAVSHPPFPKLSDFPYEIPMRVSSVHRNPHNYFSFFGMAGENLEVDVTAMQKAKERVDTQPHSHTITRPPMHSMR